MASMSQKTTDALEEAQALNPTAATTTTTSTATTATTATPTIFIQTLNGNYSFVAMNVNSPMTPGSAAVSIGAPLDSQLIAKDLFQRRLERTYPTRLIFKLSVPFLIVNVLILLYALLLNADYQFNPKIEERYATLKMKFNQVPIMTSLANVVYAVLAIISSKIKIIVHFI
jgi:hypothetical protein